MECPQPGRARTDRRRRPRSASRSQASGAKQDSGRRHQSQAGKVLSERRAIEGAAEAKVRLAAKHCAPDVLSEAAFPADYSGPGQTADSPTRAFFCPASRRKASGELVVAVDCSGSISDRILGVFQAEVQALVDEHRPSKCTSSTSMRSSKSARHFCGGEAITLEPAGGGRN